ncbi:hypothetical protein [Actinomadura atramentaria]|uniref:hypothetical protein n=1 Tax=Actinomadura atramentaria TaxID=1990 RepID=UPI00037EE93F|nr:hypothetical protein [Actinomadura atramentaria]
MSGVEAGESAQREANVVSGADIRRAGVAEVWELADAAFRSAMRRYGISPLAVDTVRHRARRSFDLFVQVAIDHELLRVEDSAGPGPASRRGLHPEGRSSGEPRM